MRQTRVRAQRTTAPPRQRRRMDVCNPRPRAGGNWEIKLVVGRNSRQTVAKLPDTYLCLELPRSPKKLNFLRVSLRAFPRAARMHVSSECLTNFLQLHYTSKLPSTTLSLLQLANFKAPPKNSTNSPAALVNQMDLYRNDWPVRRPPAQRARFLNPR